MEPTEPTMCVKRKLSEDKPKTPKSKARAKAAKAKNFKYVSNKFRQKLMGAPQHVRKQYEPLKTLKTKTKPSEPS